MSARRRPVRHEPRLGRIGSSRSRAALSQSHWDRVNARRAWVVPASVPVTERGSSAFLLADAGQSLRHRQIGALGEFRGRHLRWARSAIVLALAFGLEHLAREHAQASLKRGEGPLAEDGVAAFVAL